MRSLILTTAADSEDFGGRLAMALSGGMRIYLKGDLGAGKTTLVRGLLRRLGVSGPVRSPTYTLLEHYPTSAFDVLHLDLYRLADAEELDYLGLRDWQDERSIWLVEWPEQGAGWLPPADLELLLQYHNSMRQLSLFANRHGVSS